MARRPVRHCKRYTLAALAASVAVTAVVSIISVEMSPARIDFSITKATRNNSSGDSGVELSITLTAGNTSPRATVFYLSIYISVCNGTSPYHGHECIGAEVATPPLPLFQKQNSTELIYAAAELVGADSPWAALGLLPTEQDFTGGKSFINISSAVYVSALVTFKRPVISWKGLYNINVTCAPVTFISQANQSLVVPCF